MKTIAKIYGLIHPDFEAKYDPQPELGLHPIQMKLRDSWELLAAKVNSDTNSALFYVTVLELDELTRGLHNAQEIDHLIKKQDMERITRWSSLLEDRFFLFPNHTAITRDMLIDDARERNLQFDPNLRLTVLGEYEGAGFTCVESWGQTFKQEMGVSDSSYVIDRSRSLHTSQFREIEEWRKRRGKEV